MTDTIVKSSVDPAEIDRINEMLLGALDQMRVPQSHAIISLVCLSVILMQPTITPDKLHEAILQVTQFICTLVSNDGDQIIDPDNPSGNGKVTLN